MGFPKFIGTIGILALLSIDDPMGEGTGVPPAGNEIRPDSPRVERVSRTRTVDDLSLMWAVYQKRYIRGGRVVSLDEDRITTSEGQGYAMLRSVWMNDRRSFNLIWRWTREHLQVRPDKLFAWKWKGKVLDSNSATDADTDVVLALILASERFSDAAYLEEALPILDSIWDREILEVEGRYFVTAGNWALEENYPTIHVAYLAPYAYELFAKVDPGHPWNLLVESSYRILHWLYVEEGVSLPPKIVFVDPWTGRLHLAHPETGEAAHFGYDAFPLFWRVAQDERWFGRGEKELQRRMLAFFKKEWEETGKFQDRYTLEGGPLSQNEARPLYATVRALALIGDRELAEEIGRAKVDGLIAKAIEGRSPYYLDNWLWFGRAQEKNLARP